MMYDSYNVYKCTNCDYHVSIPTVISQNTFGAKVYSDAKVVAPMLENRNDLAKCKTCQTFFWLRSENKIGAYGTEDEHHSLRKSSDSLISIVDNFNIYDFFKALVQNNLVTNKDYEIYIRKHIMWLYNDRIRFDQNIFQEEHDEKLWKDNLKKLYNLLDDTDKNLMLKAEIQRNLGDFENCLEILKNIHNDELNSIKEKLIYECKKKNRQVIDLKYEEEF